MHAVSVPYTQVRITIKTKKIQLILVCSLIKLAAAFIYIYMQLEQYEYV